MYLFTRRARIASGGGAVLAQAVAMTEFVNNNSGLDVTLWTSALGPEPGTIVWSSMIEKRSALIEANEKLLPMEEYWAIADGLGQHLTPMIDSIRSPLHMTGELATDHDYVTVMMAQVTGSLADAATWSIEIADLATEITGSPIVVSADTVGPLGQISWMGTAPDIDTVDDQANAMWADGRYMEKLTSAAGLFQSGVGGQSTFRRVG